MRSYEQVAKPRKEWQERGFVEIQKGKVASIVLAGGKGTRLGSDRPKALFRFPSLGGCSLLEILASKMVDAAKKAQRPLSSWILCSEENREALEQHVRALQLPPLIHWSFVAQKNILHPSGDLGPGGNGALYRSLAGAGALDQWLEEGTERVMVIPIDNPLAHPFDPMLIGFSAEKSYDACLVALENRGEYKTMGALAEMEGRLRIVEYYENGGRLMPSYCNANQFCFSRGFFARAAQLSLPYHLVKRAPGTKKEQLLFDALHITKNTGALVYDLDRYAPLKEPTGPYGIAAVTRALEKMLAPEEVLS